MREGKHEKFFEAVPADVKSIEIFSPTGIDGFLSDLGNFN
jgi:hypothetical protein